jgi:predicted porin
MNYRSRRARLCAGVCVYVAASLLGAAGTAKAQTADDLRALKAQIDALQAKVKDLESKQQQSDANAQAAKKQASEAQAQAAQAKASASQATATAAKTQTQVANLPVKGTEKDEWFFRHKKGDPLTFETPGGEITAYGNIDVSFDGASKSVTGWFGSAANGHCGYGGGFCTATGNFGWMPDISTNLSYLGVRGFQRLPGSDWRFVYQLEAGFDVSAYPSNRQSNSNLSNQVNGALFSRNSYIGLANPSIGAIKIGKEDTPYKSSTAAFNPFSGMWGDYSVIMGNTGGDNRVEFGYRASHAIWYESPNMGGFQWNLLYAPGQNRSWISDNIASGESDCAGNNDPTSGAPAGFGSFNCTDGSFSDLISANISYTNGGFYATAAYEWHHAVNRQSDVQGMFGIVPPPAVGVFGNCQNGAATTFTSTLCMQDVADEDAAKIGALYKFDTGTTVGAIVEHMTRYVPGDLQFQNERTRWGTWAFVSQQLTPTDSIHFGWAHAFRANGDPGQHNDCILPTPNGSGSCYAPNNNQADMVTAAYKHQFSKNLTWYTDIAATFNGPSAHYDLGAGGRGVTTDCHDANDLAGGSASGGAFASPNCFTGTTLVGVSTGLQWRF